MRICQFHCPGSKFFLFLFSLSQGMKILGGQTLLAIKLLLEFFYGIILFPDLLLKLFLKFCLLICPFP
jgi:hypothetical protein